MAENSLQYVLVAIELRIKEFVQGSMATIPISAAKP